MSDTDEENSTGMEIADADADSYTSFDSKAGMTQKEREEIAAKENKLVFWLRALVLLVLAISAVVVSIIVYRHLDTAERNEFEKQFHSDAQKVLEAIGKSFDDTLGATDAFVTKIVSYARYSGSVWPFVTMPDFGLHASKLLKLSKAFQMTMAHELPPEQREQWEQYSANNTDWIQECVDILKTDEDYEGLIVDADGWKPSPQLYGFEGPVADPQPVRGTYMPFWQMQPMVPGDAPGKPNWDQWVLSSVAEPYNLSMATQQVTMSRDFGSYVFDPDDETQVYIAGAGQAWAAQFVGPDYDVNSPVQSFFYPIVDTVKSIRIDPKQEHKVVAMLQQSFFLRDLIQDILPSNSFGVLVVIENLCGKGQVVTFQVDGPRTTLLGAGDHHDPKYNHLEYISTFGQLMDSSKTDRERHYTGLPLNDDYCTKTIRVYPSQVMEDEYVTSDPKIFTAVAAGIFVFASMIFLLYDCTVARRQRIVLTRALASGAIVDSLFPKKVRDQLYEEKKKEEKAAAAADNFMAVPDGGQDEARPIADLFDETTVMFADLAGFTQWSSTRTPTQVFELLETLYQAFDLIATRRSVFKVETIGDCYLAVTGIPNRQPDHAVIMVKFARDCMVKMNQLTNELTETLGEDTAELKMRVGLHSGATTAGVLRGEKGRFQLFGDTVNTAARMESNGVKGRIHVSEATAQALTAKGKGHWLSRREDKIVAKGKGEMQTYFANPNYTGQSTRSGSTRSATGSIGELPDTEENLSSLAKQQLPEQASTLFHVDVDSDGEEEQQESSMMKNFAEEH